MKPLSEIFSINLRNCLYMAGMTQAELARKMKVTETAVSHWMNGTTVPRLKKIDEICSILRCSKDDLLIDHEKTVMLAPTDILADEMEQRPELYTLFNLILKMSSADVALMTDIAKRLEK